MRLSSAAQLRVAYLMAILAIVWAVILWLVAERIGGLSAAPAIFFDVLGTVLLGITGMALAVSGLRRRRESRRGLLVALLLNASLVTGSLWAAVHFLH